MQFEVELTGTRSWTAQEVFTYCLSRVRDRWPDAVFVFDDMGCCSRSIKSVRLSTQQIEIFKNHDVFLTKSLLGKKVPALFIYFKDNRISFRSEGEAEEVAKWLASLPIWAYKVRSERLSTVES